MNIFRRACLLLSLFQADLIKLNYKPAASTWQAIADHLKLHTVPIRVFFGARYSIVQAESGKSSCALRKNVHKKYISCYRRTRAKLEQINQEFYKEVACATYRKPFWLRNFALWSSVTRNQNVFTYVMSVQLMWPWEVLEKICYAHSWASIEEPVSIMLAFAVYTTRYVGTFLYPEILELLSPWRCDVQEHWTQGLKKLQISRVVREDMDELWEFVSSVNRFSKNTRNS